MARVKTATPEVSTIGAAIRRYRESLGKTVADLAKSIDVSRNTFTNYESGHTEPTAGDIVRIAKALGCSVGDLLGSEKVVAHPRFAFRAHATLRRDSNVTLLARRFLRAYGEIEEITQTRLCNRIRPFVCQSSTQLTDRQIEAIAEDLRQNCGIQDCGPENIASVLENLGVRCLFFPFESTGLDGISAIQGDVMLTMLRDSSRNVERVIFSAAHELAHLILHPFLFTESAVEFEDTNRYEKEANVFASSFLVPSNELLRVWREDGLSRLPMFHALLILKRIFHVSYWSLFYRVRSLQLTDMTWPAFTIHTKKCMGISGKAKVSDLEPEPLDNNSLYKTTRFELLVRSAFIQQLIGVAKVAELLQVSVEKANATTSQWLRPANESRKSRNL